jgi:hypothetical protein
VFDPTSTSEITRTGVRSLASITQHAQIEGAVRKGDIGWGDRVVVRTRNSIYSIWALGQDNYAVSGGWFDGQNISPATVKINGCTYGGTAIRQDIIAAPGLFLEFGNNVLTTRILEVKVERFSDPPGLN